MDAGAASSQRWAQLLFLLLHTPSHVMEAHSYFRNSKVDLHMCT